MDERGLGFFGINGLLGGAMQKNDEGDRINGECSNSVALYFHPV